MKEAVLIGATGLVGSEILKNLLKNKDISKIRIFGRRSVGILDKKVEEYIVDFKDLSSWKNKIRGEMAFSALGTTKAQAGSISAQYEVDFTYQAEFAKACKQNGIKSFTLISSVGADAESIVPYTKMKGELENFVEALNFENLHILRPGPLEGPREKSRLSEEISVPIMKVMSHIPGFRAYHPVQGRRVAEVAVAVSFLKSHRRIIGPKEILDGSFRQAF